jgi:hypothetical protein
MHRICSGQEPPSANFLGSSLMNFVWADVDKLVITRAGMSWAHELELLGLSRH